MSEYVYWLFLLLPIFFGLGWLAARIDIRHLLDDARQIPQAYFAGLDFLLKDQPDKALEAFQRAATLDRKTMELRFALGSLYRRRGDLEQATQIHHGLIANEELTEVMRQQALYELAVDYQKAGLLDHAEATFHKLQQTPLATEAKARLLEIYQQEKNWEKAITMAQALPNLKRNSEVAHYHCELAQHDLIHQDYPAAQSHLALALGNYRQCVRANILSGDLADKLGDINAAIACWEGVEQQNPDFLPLVAERISLAYHQLGKTQTGINLLKNYLAAYPAFDLLEIIYRQILTYNGKEAAFQLVREQLVHHPTLLGLEKYLAARLPLVPSAMHEESALALNIVQNYTRQLARYTCDTCGFKARKYYWQCPACGTWDSYPIRRSDQP